MILNVEVKIVLCNLLWFLWMSVFCTIDSVFHEVNGVQIS